MHFHSSDVDKSRKPTVTVGGIAVFKGFLDRPAQENLVELLRQTAQNAPFFSPQTPYGKPMSVKLTAAGKFGWFSDRAGYRYVDKHPDGTAWPAIPKPVLDIWSDLAPSAPQPECCLVNFYGENTRMGLHQDKCQSQSKKGPSRGAKLVH